MVTSTIDATVTLLKERILLFLTMLVTAPVECRRRRGCGLLVKAQATARVDVPTAHTNVVFCSFEQSDVGSLAMIEAQKSSHWNEKTTSLSGTLVSLTQPGVHISLAMS